MADYTKINEIVTTDVNQLKPKLLARMAALGMKHSPNPLTNIVTLTSQKFGLINRIRIRFKRSGVFVAKGVGRGTTAAEVGSTNRQPKDWFDAEVEPFADNLSNKLADEFVEIAFNNLPIR